MTAPNAAHYADLARKLMAESRARREQDAEPTDELAGDTTPTPERPADATAWAERARAALRAKESE